MSEGHINQNSLLYEKNIKEKHIYFSIELNKKLIDFIRSIKLWKNCTILYAARLTSNQNLFSE
jgi:hypothetical protein